MANGLSVENPGMGTFPMGTAGGKSLPAAGGRMAHSTLGGRGTSGHYMSSTARDNSFVYSLNFADTRAKPSDFNSVYGFGFTVRCVQDVLNGGENHVLYFDSSDASHPLKVGRWAATRAGDGNVKRGNGTEPMKAVTKVGDMAFFKFGSVVGFTGGSEIEPFSSARIKFDPSTNQGVYAGSDGEQLYGNIPVYTYNTEKMNVSDRATYHTGANLHAGKGDPCRLAGFDISTLTGSAADAALLAAYDSGWRLPTVEENRIFVGLEPTDFNQVQHGSPQYDTQIGGGSWTSNYSLPLNNPGIAPSPANIHAPGIALPAAGLCDRNYGTINRPGNRGDYWSSTALTSEAGFTLYLSEEYASPSLENGYADGTRL